MKKVEVYKWSENPFQIIGRDFALLTAGEQGNVNAMTIAWATIGVLWSKNIITTYVRPSRYTYTFMEENDYFTVSFYKKEYQKELGMFGSKSGRDVDKIALANFHPVVLEEGAITFEEARLTFVCKKLYAQDLDQQAFTNDIKNRFYPNNDIHRTYVGEVVAIYSTE